MGWYFHQGHSQNGTSFRQRLCSLLVGMKKTYTQRVLSLWAVFSALVAVVGPFDTYAQFAPVGRLIYWAVFLGAAMVAARLCRRALRPWLDGHRPWTRGVVVSAALATVYAPLVFIINRSLYAWTGHYQVPLSTLWLSIFLASIIESALWIITHSAPAAAVAAPAAVPERGPAPVPPRLLSRLEPELQGEIQSLSVRDHYVAVSTTGGTGTLLMRFADALDELGDVEGLRIHRSHWVARRAMVRVEREPGKMFLRLDDGRKLPVSRSYRDEVLALGLEVIESKDTAQGGVPNRTAHASAAMRPANTVSVQGNPPV